MKKSLLFLSFLLTPLFFLRASDSNHTLNFTNFSGGLNSYYSSLTIAENEVHDALNVYFTKDNAVTKRKGYSLYGSTAAVSFQGAWQYIDATNNIWMVVRSSDSIRASPGTGSFTVKIGTCPTPATSNVSAVNAFGKIWFVDNVSGVYSWDGTTTQYISGSPKGTIITEFHGRLWVGGLSVPTQNYLYGSGYLDGTNWTTGTLATDPVLYQIGLNDRADGITAFWSGYNDTLYIFKNLSINALYGFDQTDFTLRILSRESGCIDPGSVQAFKGYLIFMSQRGLERFDGVFPVRISSKIKDRVDPATSNFFSQRSWIQDSGSDFSLGTSVNVDTFSTVGIIQISTNNTNISNNGWESCVGLGNCSGWTGYNGVWVGGDNIYVHDGSKALLGNTILSYTMKILDSSSNTLVSQNLTPTESVWTQRSQSLSAYRGKSIMIQFYSPDATHLTHTSDAFLCSGNTITWWDLGRTSLNAIWIDTVEGGKSTITSGNYTSQTEDIGTNITTFGNLLTSQDSPAGTSLTYQVCTSTLSNMSGSTCVSVTPGSQITAPVRRYLQVKPSFSYTSGTNAPTLDYFKVQWNEGIPRPKMSSVVYDDRYWLALATSTADSSNDSTIIMTNDLQGNPVFSIFSIQAGAYFLYKNALYHADSNATGNVYVEDVGYSDNGSAINSYFQTKDFSPDGLILDKYFLRLYVFLDSLGPYSLSTSYMVDRNPVVFSLSDIMQNEQNGLINVSLPISADNSHQNFGKTISFKFSNSTVDQSFNVYGGTLDYIFRRKTGNLNAQ